MESGIQRLLLIVAFGIANGSALAAEPADLDLAPLAVQEPERRSIEIDEIDSENFEIGVFGGMMNNTDFGTNSVTGVRAYYHVSQDFFLEGTYGMSSLDRTSFERLSGGADILTDDQRDLTYYSASVGYNVLPGEAFIGKNRAFRGALYLVGGAGSTEFGGEDRFTANFGFGYRLVGTDWLAVHAAVRDHVFESDLLGTDETYHNLEFTGSLSLFF